MENDSRNQEVNKAPVPQTADIVPDNAPACQKDVVVRPPAASPGNGTENHVAQFPETEETKKLRVFRHFHFSLRGILYLLHVPQRSGCDFSPLCSRQSFAFVFVVV